MKSDQNPFVCFKNLLKAHSLTEAAALSDFFVFGAPCINSHSC